jgi:hypothetical protein
MGIHWFQAAAGGHRPGRRRFFRSNDCVSTSDNRRSARADRPLPRAEPLEQRVLLSLSPHGNAFRVNADEPHDQFDADVAMAANGDFVAVWLAMNREANSHGITGRRFNANGTPKGLDFVVTPQVPPPAFAGFMPTVAMAPDGRFVVAWVGGAVGRKQAVVRAQRFGPDGQPVGESFIVDPDLDDTGFGVGNSRDLTSAMSDDGRFVIAWRHGALSGDAASTGQVIRTRLFDASGEPVGAGFNANSSAAVDARHEIGSAMDADGDFVITWHNVHFDGPTRSDSIVARSFARNGTPHGAEFTVENAAGAGGHSAVAMDADGDFVVTWTEYAHPRDNWISGRQFGATGQPKADAFRVYTRDRGGDIHFPDVVMADDGRFLVAWKVSGATQDSGLRHWIFARPFDAAAQPLADAAVLGEADRPGWNANAAMNGDGDRAVVIWSRADKLPFGNDNVYARRLADGVPQPANLPPVATPISGVKVNQGAPDTRIPLYRVFQDDNDADSDLELSVSANTNPALFSATTIDAEGVLTLGFAPGAAGTATLTVTARDTGGLSTPVSFTVIVNPPGPGTDNTAPTTSGVPDLAGTADGPDGVLGLYSYFDDAQDPDAALRLAVHRNSNPALFTSVSINAAGVLTLDYAPGAAGIAEIIVTATDTAGLTTPDTFKVTVTAAAPAPTPPTSPTPVVPSPLPTGPGAIRGQLFHDADGNGRRSKREAPLPGVSVFLDTDGDETPDDAEPKALTGADGSYAFTALPAGAYRVRVSPPAGWRAVPARGAPPSAGAAGGNARAVFVRGRARAKPVALKPLGLTPAGSISGTVFLDTNANGARDAGEPPLGRSRVFIDTNRDGVWQKTERAVNTDRAGNWVLHGVAGGTHHLNVVRRGYALTPPGGLRFVVMSDGDTVNGVDLGVSPLA